MIELSTSKGRVDLEQLKELFAQVGWGDKTSNEARFRNMVENSTLVVTAWDGDRMVGFGRATTDRAFNGQINNLVVASDYRGRGIGRQIMDTILREDPRVTYVLRGDPENEEFYRRLGFDRAERALVYRRRE
jgi:ribosomal protein S18 acetylase RimI-like enzyme